MRAAVALLVVAAGCATPYQPKGPRGGFTDFPVRNGVHCITVDGNGYTDASTLTQYWHRRARELCGGDYDFTESGDSTAQIIHGEAGPTLITRHQIKGYASCRNRLSP